MTTLAEGRKDLAWSLQRARRELSERCGELWLIVERCEQVDDVAIRIEDRGVALAPERIER